MADKRAYFKLDVGYLTNPKVASLALDHPQTVLLHIASIAYAAQHLTDGVVPVRLLLRINGASETDADLLFKSGLWIDTGNDTAEIHDYLEHQRSAAEVKVAEDKAKRAAHARWNASSMPQALPTASESAMPRERERERDINNKGASAPRREDVDSLCSLLADLVEANGSKRPTVTNRWRDSARLLLDKDGRDAKDVARVIRWSQASDFWSPNILSMPKLREKFDTLRLQAEREARQQAPRLRDNRPEGW